MSKRGHLFDLPDEILLIIVKELTMLEALCSLADVHPRLTRLVHDFLYIRHLDLTSLTTYSEQVSSLLRQKTLPRIRDQVQRMVVEPYSLQDIIGAGSYPQLHSLALRNFKDQDLYQHLKGMFVVTVHLLRG